MNEKEKLLIEYLLSSPDTFTLCRSIVKPEYFTPELRKSVDFMIKYFDQYSALPSPTQVFAESAVSLTTHPVTSDQVKYCATEMEQFCRQRALEDAVLNAAKLVDTPDFGKIDQLIKDAMLVSLNKDLGINYFHNPLARLEAQAAKPLKIPTKYTLIDDALNGGIARGEMLLLSANSGGGKSITLTNLGIQYLSQQMCVLYLSLELSESMIAQRCDVMFTGIPTVLSREKYTDIATQLDAVAHDMDTMVIKHMPPGTNSNQIRSYLKEFELMYSRKPDVIIVDYLDLMGTNEKVSADNVWEKDKRATEQLREIGVDYDAIILTASQQNRAALEATELNQGHIAGGISKVNTVDVYVSIILTPHMKAQGEIGFVFLKTRSSDAVGKTVFLKWNNNRLRIENPDSNSTSSYTMAVDSNPVDSAPTKKTLLDLYSKFVDD